VLKRFEKVDKSAKWVEEAAEAFAEALIPPFRMRARVA
jgi:hypothetical protein